MSGVLPSGRRGHGILSRRTREPQLDTPNLEHLQSYQRFSVIRAWSPRSQMTRPGLCVAGVVALASMLSAQVPAPTARRGVAAPAPPPASTFQKYCFECHGTKKPEAGLSIEKLLGQFSISAHSENWEKVADMLETGMMPPLEATEQPTRRRARGDGGVDPWFVEGVRNRSRGRARARDGPAVDERRVRLCDSRSDRHRGQSRHRRIERLGRWRGFRELRRCPVRAG